LGKYADDYVHRWSVEGEGALLRSTNKNVQAGKRLEKQQRNTQKSQQALLDTIGFVGPKAEMAGDSMIRFANKAVTLAQYSEEVDKELEAMFDQKNLGADALKAVRDLSSEIQDVGGVADEESKRAATLMASFAMSPTEILRFMPLIASQAKVTRSSVESVAMAVGKAFGSGQYGQLSRYGVTLDSNAKKQLEMAQALSRTGDATKDAEGRAIAYKVVLAALEENVPALSERMKTASGRIDRFGETWGDVQEQIGGGASAAQAAMADLGYGLLRPLVGANKELQSFVGWTTYGVGGVLKLGGTIGSQYGAWLQYISAIKMSRAVQMANSAATTGGIAPATGLATANKGLATSFLGVAGSIAVVTAALIAAYLVWRTAKVAFEARAEKKYGKAVDKDTEAMREEWVRSGGTIDAEGRMKRGARSGQQGLGAGYQSTARAPKYRSGDASMNRWGDLTVPGVGGVTPERVNDYSQLGGG